MTRRRHQGQTRPLRAEVPRLLIARTNNALVVGGLSPMRSVCEKSRGNPRQGNSVCWFTNKGNLVNVVPCLRR